MDFFALPTLVFKEMNEITAGPTPLEVAPPITHADYFSFGSEPEYEFFWETQKKVVLNKEGWDMRLTPLATRSPIPEQNITQTPEPLL